ncbi:MAG TPA: cation transporter [Streptosporangiaceae bacterium]|nr:cation transporter [Streptosporangiaceae bacterium]
MSELTLPASPGRDRLNRRARHLAWVTIGYNAAEGIIALAAGAAASSTALVSFGLDSAIEVSAATAVAWQFAHSAPEQRERRTLRLIAWSFFALAAWVAVDAVRSLLGAGEAEPSAVGIALTAASLAVMPALMGAKRRTGRALGSATVIADSTQTLLCTYLSAVVLAGLAANAALGWTWADPAAALVVAAIAVREGVQAWRGDACCGLADAAGRDQGCHDGCAC